MSGTVRLERPRAYNRHLMAGLWRPRVDELQVRVHYLDAWEERAVMMLVGTSDFAVRYAEVVSHRVSRGEPAGCREVPELRGLTAYVGGGREFRRAFSGRQDADQWLELFMEGVKVLIEAEYYVAAERGFSSGEEYDIYFAEVFADSCLYYSYPLEVPHPFDVYVGNQARDGCLFMRFRTTTLTVGDRWRVNSIVTDSFHDLVLRLELDAAGDLVTGAEVSIVRLPHDICKEARGIVVGLTGRSLKAMDRGELALVLGGRRGCMHLVDLTAEAASLVQLVHRQALNLG